MERLNVLYDDHDLQEINIYKDKNREKEMIE